MIRRGKFITFEGIDGAGKTTHLAWVAKQLRTLLTALDKNLVVTREPGGTPLGETLRDLLLHREMHLETEALLMFAARREHLATVIEPTLTQGNWVLSDRFSDATFAYQGGGRGLALDKLETLERWVQNDVQPDLTVLLDLPVEIALARCGAARTPDKFENESATFFNRTRNEYLRRAHQASDRFVIIDATLSITEIQQLLAEILIKLLDGLAHS